MNIWRLSRRLFLSLAFSSTVQDMNHLSASQPLDSWDFLRYQQRTLPHVCSRKDKLQTIIPKANCWHSGQMLASSDRKKLITFTTPLVKNHLSMFGAGPQQTAISVSTTAACITNVFMHKNHSKNPWKTNVRFLRDFFRLGGHQYQNEHVRKKDK